MATDRQIEANRKNALLSTGPKSDDGKARSSANAVTHGLTSNREVLPLLACERREMWDNEIHPRTMEARFALDRAVAASFRIEECERAFNAVMAEAVLRARDDWDADRKLEAARLGDKLSKNPVPVAAELEATRHGCHYKFMLWNSLGDAIDSLGLWTEAQSSVALDLLGVPTAFRVGRTPIAPGGACDLLAFRRDLVLSEIKRLETRMAELSSIEMMRRIHAEAGRTAILSAPAALIQRYERDATRRFNAAMKIAKAPPQAEDTSEVEALIEEIEAEFPVDETEPAEFDSPESTVPMPKPSESNLNRRQRLALKSRQRRA